MDLRLAGKTAVITGASGGIGRALAAAFAGEGARLALLAHRNLHALVARVAREPWRNRALCLAADVTSPREVQAAMDRAARRFGRVDVCVANAGVWPPDEVPLHRLSERRLRATIEVDLLGALWTARAFLRALARAGPRADGHGASLLFIGSTAGRFGEAGHVDYAAAKAGLHGLVRSLKNEIVALDPYGRVNMVEPGWTVTGMTRGALGPPAAVAGTVRTMPLRQLARAEDIARAVLFLSSPAAARHISGEVLTVAGGMEGRVLWEPGQIDGDAIRRRLDAE